VSTHRSMNAALIAIATLAGCETSQQLASACRHGVCTQASSVAAPACVLNEWTASVEFKLVEPVDPVYAICGPHRGDGDALSCKLYWSLDKDVLPSGESFHGCGDLAALEDVSADELRRWSHPPAHVCRIKAVAVDNGQPAAGASGWYMDDFSTDFMRSCSPSSSMRLVVTVDTLPVAPSADDPSTLYGAMVTAFCEHTALVEDSDGSFASGDSAQCKLPSDSATFRSNVGKACLPEANNDDQYSELEAVLETNSTECDTGACLVYRLSGDPARGCTPSRTHVCATEDELKAKAYCSCRCDAPDADPSSLCHCPHGFSCVPTLEDGPASARGSYCLKDGTFTER
jgi:hypothetical protein